MTYDCHVYIGAFTSEFQTGAMSSGVPAKGIEVLRFDGNDATLEPLRSVAGLLSPSFLALHPKLPVLYAVERFFDAGDRTIGAMTSFSIEDDAGQLEMTARLASRGESPALVSVHPSGQHAYVAHYQSGHVAAFPLDERGRVQPADTVILHEGSGPHPRQASAHPHHVRPAPNGKFVHVMDLGSDAIVSYPTEEDGRLAAIASSRVSLPPGTGPRHFAWHPSGTFAFTNGEINSTLCLLRADAERGELEFVSAHSTLPQEFAGESTTAEVVCHPSGRVVYVSNRGHDSIAVFDFDPSTASLTYRGTQSTLGRSPHNFSLDPRASFLVAANRTSGTLVVYRLDPLTLWPEPTGFTLDVPAPSCVLFRPIAS